MCKQLHWWQCSPFLMTWLQRQKSVSLSPCANGPLVRFFVKYTHRVYIHLYATFNNYGDLLLWVHYIIIHVCCSWGHAHCSVKTQYVATKVVQGVDLFKMVTQRVQSSDLSLLFMTIFPQQKSTKCKISAYFVKSNHYLMNYIYFI